MFIETGVPIAPYELFIAATSGGQNKIREVDSVAIPTGRHWYAAHYAKETPDGMIWNTQIAVDLFPLLKYFVSDCAPNDARLELHLSQHYVVDSCSTVPIKRVFEAGGNAFILQSIDDQFFLHDGQSLVNLLYNGFEGLDIIHQPPD